MIKYLGLLSLAMVIGCSSSQKKEAASVTPAKTETKATPAAETAAIKESPAQTSQKDSSKKSKKEAVAKSTTSATGDITCTSGKDERRLAVKAKGEGCELEYTKSGQASSVASQIIGNAKCEEVSTKIKDKLIAAGYKCE